jgi:hypothetical protein|tara:strand:+ start:832 stop:1182 length:351 start_codon:yes stop_codon:yes gene_type:complete
MSKPGRAEKDEKMSKKLGEITRILRSKNAGAFYVTFDIIFDNRESFDEVEATGVINEELFARLYGVPKEQCKLVTFPRASAFKCSMPRPMPAGDIGDTDVYGCQWHTPLLDVEIPI